MNTVYFKNEGLIDLTAIKTFGVNAKETDNPFGFFGTGLKYAIAILLRNEHEVVVWRGLEPYRFTIAEKLVRNQPFKIVCMNDEELGFTLDLGKTWEMWQAFRELYCNTMDESGEVSGTVLEQEDGMTLITVTGDKFYSEYGNRSKIILQGKPIFSLEGTDVHEGSNNHLFFKTIRVGDVDRPTHFTYNFTSRINLTEDRTIKNLYDVGLAMRQIVSKGSDKEFIRQFATVPDGTFEAVIDMDWSDVPSQSFLEVMGNLSFKEITNSSLLRFYQNHVDSLKTPKPVKMTDVEVIQLERAIKFCNGINYPVDKYRINVTEDLKDSILGMVYGGEIYISRRTFLQGTKQVAATVLEEYLHIENKYEDETYLFQTYLFDVIVSLGEQLNGEPI